MLVKKGFVGTIPALGMFVENHCQELEGQLLYQNMLSSERPMVYHHAIRLASWLLMPFCRLSAFKASSGRHH